MTIYAQLAKDTIEMYIKDSKLPDTSKLPYELVSKRAGCFVSIHKYGSEELRGCIGTLAPKYKNLGGEIISNAIEAAFHDSRFEPVASDELNTLEYSVDVLGEPEEIKNETSLDPKKYGVIVKAVDGRTGLLLPNLKGITTTQKQIEIAREKAGIIPDEKVLLYRFTSMRYE